MGHEDIVQTEISVGDATLWRHAQLQSQAHDRRTLLVTLATVIPELCVHNKRWSTAVTAESRDLVVSCEWLGNLQ